MRAAANNGRMHATTERDAPPRAARHPAAAAVPELLQLRAGDLHLSIAPEVGGSIAAFDRRWSEHGAEHVAHWLRPATPEGLAQRHPLAMASFPLVPFCNRIRAGRASFEGREIRFPPNHPAEDSPHPLHGIGWQRPWQVESAGEHRAVLSLRVPAGPAWPWSFSAEQVYELWPHGLSVRMRLTNEDSVAMPAGIGHHPYFPHEPGTRLTARADAIWEADDEVMPTGLAETDVVRRLREGARLADLHTDNNFTGWSRQAFIEWPARDGIPARSVLLQAEAPLDFFVLYCQRGYDFFCAEPVSQCTDWLNLASRYPRQVLGGTRLEPGRSLEARFSLTPRSW
jgi:aldose 1-epimerase